MTTLDHASFLRRLGALSLMASLPLCVLACGGDDGEEQEAPTLSFSAGGSTKVSDLSDDQAQSVCDETDAYAATQIDETRTLCFTLTLFQIAFSGVETDAEAQAMCAMTFDACLQSPPQP